MTDIPRRIVINGDVRLVIPSSEPPTPEELSDYARAIANAKRRIATLDEFLDDLRSWRERILAQVSEAESQLSHARTMLSIRSEGYELAPVEQATAQAIADKTGGVVVPTGVPKLPDDFGLSAGSDK